MGTVVFILVLTKCVYLMALSPQVDTFTVNNTVYYMKERLVNLENKFHDMIIAFGSKEMEFKAELQRIREDNEMLKRNYFDLYSKYIHLEKTIKEGKDDGYRENGFKKQAQVNSFLDDSNYFNQSKTDREVSVTRKEEHKSFISSNLTKTLNISEIKRLFAIKTMDSDTNELTFQPKSTMEDERNNIRNKDSRNTPFVHDSAVAFYAKLRSPIKNVGDNQPIIFDQIVTLEGNDYSGTTGVFTCSVPGLYVFSVTLLTYPDKFLEVQVLHNGSAFAILYSFTDDHYGSSSSTTVIRLNIGDRVWTRVYGNGHSGSGSILNNGYSTFTGFLLHS